MKNSLPDQNEAWNNAMEKIVGALIALGGIFSSGIIVTGFRESLMILLHFSVYTYIELAFVVCGIFLLFSRRWAYIGSLTLLYFLLMLIIYHLLSNLSEEIGTTPLFVIILFSTFLVLCPLMLIGLLTTTSSKEKYGITKKLNRMIVGSAFLLTVASLLAERL